MSVTTRPRIERTKHWTYIVHTDDGPVELPSVTTIINATCPKELGWYGMRIGVSGMLAAGPGLVAECLLADVPLDAGIELLKTKKITTFHYMNNAKEVGSEVHRVIEEYIKTGSKGEKQPTPLASVRLEAFSKFLDDHRPTWLASEVMTASLEHGYAGTFDARCIFGSGPYVNRRAIIDFKNTGRIYEDQYFPQIAAYEAAEVELGEQPSDLCLIVRLCDDGNYEIGVSRDSLDDFLVLKNHWHSIQNRKVRKKNAKAKRGR